MSVKENFEYVKAEIAKAAEKSGRNADDVLLLAVTKLHSPEEMNEAIDAGATDIGENKVQEVLSKYDKVKPARWHLIGHLQTNKVRQIIDKVAMIQSVDSRKLAAEISKQSVKNGIVSNILIEVNIGREENKSGVLKEELDELIGKISEMPNIKIRGLMTVPPICKEKIEVCKFFDEMYQLFIDFSCKKSDNVCMDYLSMGMSDDYEEAVLSGANMVRVGSRLFGQRIYR